MRRITCREFGPPDRLTLEEAPDPRPGPGEVLVRVRAAGVSFVDGLIAGGKYQLKPPLPFTPGLVAADWGAWSRADPAGNHALISDVLAQIAAGELHPVAPESYPLERAGQALTVLARRQVAGKLALLP